MSRATALAIAVTIAIIAALLLLSQCSTMRNRASQERVEDAQAGAATNSAADAIATQGQANQRERAAVELDRVNEEDIRNAPGSDAKVDPRASDAGRRALCLRDAYRNRPECQLQQPAPR